LEFDSIVVLNHGANGGILDLAVMQVHTDFVADLELTLWFFGRHARNLRRRQGYFQGCELTMTSQGALHAIVVSTVFVGLRCTLRCRLCRFLLDQSRSCPAPVGVFVCRPFPSTLDRKELRLLPCNSSGARTNLRCPKLYQNPIQLRLRGLLRARSRFPEIIAIIRKRE